MSSQTYYMPIPRTSEAPCFNGRNLSKFMTALEHHLSCAKITAEDIRVNYIMRYSCEEIRRDIGHLSELDRSKTGKSWKEAKLFLLDFYGELDEDSPLAEFRKWIQTMADKPAFVSETQVNTYYTDFMSRGQPLLDNVQISYGDLCFAFIQGVPSSMKATLRHLIPAERRNRFAPYALNDTLSLLLSLVPRIQPIQPPSMPPSFLSDPSPPSASSPALATIPVLSAPTMSLPTNSRHASPLHSLPNPLAPSENNGRQPPKQPSSDTAHPGYGQDEVTRDDTSVPQLEAKHTVPTASDIQQTTELDVQMFNHSLKQPHRQCLLNHGDLSASAASLVHQVDVAVVRESPYSEPSTPECILIAERLPSLNVNDRPMDLSVYLDHARVGVGGHQLPPYPIYSPDKPTSTPTHDACTHDGDALAWHVGGLTFDPANSASTASPIAPAPPIALHDMPVSDIVHDSEPPIRFTLAYILAAPLHIPLPLLVAFMLTFLLRSLHIRLLSSSQAFYPLRPCTGQEHDHPWRAIQPPFHLEIHMPTLPDGYDVKISPSAVYMPSVLVWRRPSR